MEEIKVKKNKPLFSRFEWICIIIFAVFGIIGLIFHFLGFDDIKCNAAEVHSLASQTDYLLVSKNDPYIMIGTPDPDGELPVDVLKVDAFGFYNFFKVPTNINLTPFPITLEAWNYLFNQLFGQPASNKNDGTVLMRYRMSAGNLEEFTGYMPVTTISHQDYYVVKATLYAASGAVAWLSTNNFIKASPVPRLSGSDLYNVYYFYVNENGSPHYYAVSSGGVLNLHRASLDDATARITYREGMVLYSYESNGWQGPINGSQSYFDSLGVPYVFNFENTAGMLKYDDECMCAVRMMSFADQQATPTPTVSPTPDPSVSSFFGFVGYYSYNPTYYYVEVTGSNIFKSVTLDILDSDVSAAMSEIGTTDPNTISGKSVYMLNTFATGSSINWGGPNAFLYFTGDDITVKVWRMSSSLISSNVDYIKSNYDYVTLDGNNINNSGYPYFTLQRVGELNCLVINCDVYRNTGSYNIVDMYDNNIDVLEFYSSSSRAYNSSVQLQKAYKALLTRTEPPSPTPDPNATPTPSPSPTPTEAPHVIVVWPTSTPTPTPVVILDPVFPSSMPPLNSGTVSSVLETGNTYLDNNNAITVLSRALAFVPNTVLSLWWFWLFVLVILAGIRVFIHFF